MAWCHGGNDCNTLFVVMTASFSAGMWVQVALHAVYLSHDASDTAFKHLEWLGKVLCDVFGSGVCRDQVPHGLPCMRKSEVPVCHCSHSLGAHSTLRHGM